MRFWLQDLSACTNTRRDTQHLERSRPCGPMSIITTLGAVMNLLEHSEKDPRDQQTGEVLDYAHHRHHDTPANDKDAEVI